MSLSLCGFPFDERKDPCASVQSVSSVFSDIRLRNFLQQEGFNPSTTTERHRIWPTSISSAICPMPAITESKTGFVLKVHRRLTEVYGSGIKYFHDWCQGEVLVGMPHSYGSPFWAFLLPLLKSFPARMPPAEKRIAAIVRTMSETAPIIRVCFVNRF